MSLKMGPSDGLLLRRSGPLRRSLFRSRIRNAWRSDIDASRRTRLAGPDPEFAVLVCHPSFGPPFPEKLDLRSHRLTPRWPGTRAADRGALKRRRPALSSPDSGSSPPSTNDIHIRSRNTQRSREYFPRLLLGSGPIPLGRGYKVCAPARARPSARKGACRGADEPALRDLEEGPGVLSEVERTGDKERSCSFFTLLGNCPCAR